MIQLISIPVPIEKKNILPRNSFQMTSLSNKVDLPKEPSPLDIMTPKLEKAMKQLRLDEIVKSLYVEFPFYGMVLYRINKKFSEEVPTAAVSFRKELKVNRKFMASLPKDQQMGILEHEVLHLALLHLKRFYIQFKDRSLHNIANIATDCAINQLVHYPLPKYAVSVDTIKKLTGNNDVKEKETAEYYYNLLIKKRDEVQEKLEQMMKCSSCDGSGDHKECGGSGCDGCEEGKCPDCGGDGLSDFGKAMKQIDQGHQKSIEGSEGEDGKLDPVAESAMRNLLQNAKDYQDRKDREAGCEPGDYFSKILPKYVNIDKRVWKRAINRTIGETPIAESNFVYNRPNRRCILSNWGKRHILENKKLYVGIDTSASISDYDLSQFCGHISKAIKSCDIVVDVIYCDTKIENVQLNVKKMSPHKPVEVNGRGGTVLSPILDYIIERENNKKARLVLMTDGYLFDEFKIPKNIEVTAIYTKDYKPVPGVRYSAVLESD